MKLIKYSELIGTFGEPGENDNFIKKPFPFSLYLNGQKGMPCINFYGHRNIANQVITAYKEIMDFFGIDFIRENGLDNYGGCYNHRQSRTGKGLSVHSWGLAIDVLPNFGKMGNPPMLPYHFVKAFLKQGFLWGGDWRNPDGMHFSSVFE